MRRFINKLVRQLQLYRGTNMRCECCEHQLLHKVVELLEHIKKQGDKIMTQQEDLQAAIKAEDVTVQAIAASATKIGADVDALLVKIGSGTPPADLANEIQAVQAHTAALQTAADLLAAADVKANPPA